MDYLGVLNVIESWPVEDRVRIVQDVWDRLQGQGLDLTDDLKTELDRRIEEMDQNPKAGLPWEVVKARILKQFQ